MSYLTLPKRGSRARNVLEALFKHQQPVPELDLMAMHGLDNLKPTMWRQGPYKLLDTAGLIFLGTSGWALTLEARNLMAKAEAELMDDEAQSEPVDLVPPRTVREFRPMKNALTMPDNRPGALDYMNIPSLYVRQTCA